MHQPPDAAALAPPGRGRGRTGAITGISGVLHQDHWGGRAVNVGQRRNAAPAAAAPPTAPQEVAVAGLAVVDEDQENLLGGVLGGDDHGDAGLSMDEEEQEEEEEAGGGGGGEVEVLGVRQNDPVRSTVLVVLLHDDHVMHLLL